MPTPRRVNFWSTQNAPDEVKDDWLLAVSRVIQDSTYIGGSVVGAFESRFAQFVGISRCVGVGNGLDALTLGLQALGIGKGHLVAVPSHTFFATWLAVLRVGASPIAVDCNKQGLIDAEGLAALDVTPTCLIPVHMHGQLVDMPAVAAWARDRNVIVLEDASQAHGALGQGWRIGSLSDAAAFSFFPTKNLGAMGDAGALLTQSQEVADTVWQLANYGSSKDNPDFHVRIGANSRLDPMQASILEVNLARLEEWNARRRAVAETYLGIFKQHEAKSVRPLVNDPDSSVWHHFVVKCDDRESFQIAMDRAGIQTKIHYPNLASSEYARIVGLLAPKTPVGRSLAKSVVSLPCHQWMTSNEVGAVADALSNYLVSGG